MNRLLLLGAALVAVAVTLFFVWPRSQAAPTAPAVTRAPADTGPLLPGGGGTPSLARPALGSGSAAPRRRPEIKPDTPVIDHRTLDREPTPLAAESLGRTPSGPGPVFMSAMTKALRPKVLACTAAVPKDLKAPRASTRAQISATVVGGELTIDAVEVTTLDVQEPAATELVACVQATLTGARLAGAGADAKDMKLGLTYPVL
jgi:hypothetical protein